MLEASNCVIDQSGRIAARKGWERAFSSNEAILASTVYLVHEYINSAGAVELLVVIGDSVTLLLLQAPTPCPDLQVFGVLLTGASSELQWKCYFSTWSLSASV